MLTSRNWIWKLWNWTHKVEMSTLEIWGLLYHWQIGIGLTKVGHLIGSIRWHHWMVKRIWWNIFSLSLKKLNFLFIVQTELWVHPRIVWNTCVLPLGKIWLLGSLGMIPGMIIGNGHSRLWLVSNACRIIDKSGLWASPPILFTTTHTLQIVAGSNFVYVIANTRLLPRSLVTYSR